MGDLQRKIDSLQVEHLGDQPTKEVLSEYFNTCLNSACGAVADKYGDAAVYILLMVWVETVKSRMKP